MSKYTTEVRYICEQKANLEASVGGESVDKIIDKSWDKIFTTKCAFFDENYREPLCKKILKHYYTREICCETVGLWILWLNTKLEEIMPYYNQLYATASIIEDPLNDINYTVIVDTNGNIAIDDNGGGSNDKTSNGTTRSLYSDTPQGALTGVENETYLTNARKNVDSYLDTGSYTNYTVGSHTHTENVTETRKGKLSTKSYSKMLEEYRKTFLNIDMKVIGEFEELFFNLW